MPDTTDHHDQTTRLPRHVYRKQLKLKKRRQRRQRPYQTDPSTTDTQSPTPTEPAPLSTTEQDMSLYLQQKAQWEAKEREYNLINQARKKVLETEKKARELAMVSARKKKKRDGETNNIIGIVFYRRNGMLVYGISLFQLHLDILVKMTPSLW